MLHRIVLIIGDMLGKAMSQLISSSAFLICLILMALVSILTNAKNLMCIPPSFIQFLYDGWDGVGGMAGSRVGEMKWDGNGEWEIL